MILIRILRRYRDALCARFDWESEGSLTMSIIAPLVDLLWMVMLTAWTLRKSPPVAPPSPALPAHLPFVWIADLIGSHHEVLSFNIHHLVTKVLPTNHSYSPSTSLHRTLIYTVEQIDAPWNCWKLAMRPRQRQAFDSLHALAHSIINRQRRRRGRLVRPPRNSVVLLSVEQQQRRPSLRPRHPTAARTSRQSRSLGDSSIRP